MTPRILSFSVGIDDPERLDRFLTDRIGAVPEFQSLTRSQIKLLIERGGVSVNGVVVEKAGTPLKPGAAIVCTWSDAPASAFAPYDTPLEILHEDDAVIVINKPASLTMHPGAGNRAHTLVNGLIAHFQRVTGGRAPELFEEAPLGAARGADVRPGIVHRLDRDTTGVVVVAKTATALQHLSRQFAARTVGRAYLALVFSTPRGLRAVNTADGGTIDAPIGRHPTRRTEMAIVPGGRHAVTHWRVRERFPYGTLVEARLETGRTHQIRVHFNSIGCPVIGDRTYGDFSGLPLPLQRAAERLGRQALHAYKLEFDHPVTGARLTFEGAPPADLQTVLGIFRGGER